MYNAPNCNDSTASALQLPPATTPQWCADCIRVPLRTLIRTSFWIKRLTGETIQLLHTKFGTQTGENIFVPTISLGKKTLNAVERFFLWLIGMLLLKLGLIVVVTDHRPAAISYQYLIPN